MTRGGADAQRFSNPASALPLRMSAPARRDGHGRAEAVRYLRCTGLATPNPLPRPPATVALDPTSSARAPQMRSRVVSVYLRAPPKRHTVHATYWKGASS